MQVFGVEPVFCLPILNGHVFRKALIEVLLVDIVHGNCL